MEKKHTELPWTFHTDCGSGKIRTGLPYWLNGKNGETIFTAFHGNFSIKEDEAYKNSQFILKACNNHYALLEVLKGLLDAANVPPGKQVEDGYAKLTKALRKGFDVIKNCEE